VKSINIGVGYGWAWRGVTQDSRWHELRDFCRSAAEHGRRSAAATIKRDVSSEDDEPESSTGMNNEDIPKVRVARLRASVGRLIWESIKEHIDDSDILVFDVTKTPRIRDRKKHHCVSPNIWIEIGYALASVRKRVFLVHAGKHAAADIPSDLLGFVIGRVPSGKAKGVDVSLRVSLACEVARLVIQRLSEAE